MLIDCRCFQVKGETAHVGMLLKVTKDMISCLKMAKVRTSLISGEKGNFKRCATVQVCR